MTTGGGLGLLQGLRTMTGALSPWRPHRACLRFAACRPDRSRPLRRGGPDGAGTDGGGGKTASSRPPVAHIQAVGPRGPSLTSAPHGGFVDGEALCVLHPPNSRRRHVAHGGTRSSSVRTSSPFRDPEERLPTAGIIRVGQTRGQGWLEYLWPNPGHRSRPAQGHLLSFALTTGRSAPSATSSPDPP